MGGIMWKQNMLGWNISCYKEDRQWYGYASEDAKVPWWRNEGQRKIKAVLSLHIHHPSFIHPFPPSAFSPSGICPFLCSSFPSSFLLSMWMAHHHSASSLSLSLTLTVCAVMYQVTDIYIVESACVCKCIEKHIWGGQWGSYWSWSALWVWGMHVCICVCVWVWGDLLNL